MDPGPDPTAAGGVIGMTGSTVGGVAGSGDPEPFDEPTAGRTGGGGAGRGGARVPGALDSVVMGVDGLESSAGRTGGDGTDRGGAGFGEVLDPLATADDALEAGVLDGLTADERPDAVLPPDPPAAGAEEFDERVALRVEPV